MKARWFLAAFAALAALLLVALAWVLLSEEVAIDSCLDGGGAWRNKGCVYR